MWRNAAAEAWKRMSIVMRECGCRRHQLGGERSEIWIWATGLEWRFAEALGSWSGRVSEFVGHPKIDNGLVESEGAEGHVKWGGVKTKTPNKKGLAACQAWKPGSSRVVKILALLFIFIMPFFSLIIFIMPFNFWNSTHFHSFGSWVGDWMLTFEVLVLVIVHFFLKKKKTSGSFLCANQKRKVE